jgi:hypothetical protein
MPNTYTLIEAKTLASATTTVSFTSIPQTYTDLVLKLSTRGTASGSGNAWQAFQIGFNGVLTNRSFMFLGSTGSAAISGSSASEIVGQAVEGSSTANTFAVGEIYIPNYTSSNFKSVSSDHATENNATAALMYYTAGLWSNTAAITQIDFTPSSGDFAVNSTFYLYGIKNS